jgi:hypothetical protein
MWPDQVRQQSQPYGQNSVYYGQDFGNYYQNINNVPPMMIDNRYPSYVQHANQYQQPQYHHYETYPPIMENGLKLMIRRHPPGSDNPDAYRSFQKQSKLPTLSIRSALDEPMKNRYETMRPMPRSNSVYSRMHRIPTPTTTSYPEERPIRPMRNTSKYHSTTQLRSRQGIQPNNRPSLRTSDSPVQWRHSSSPFREPHGSRSNRLQPSRASLNIDAIRRPVILDIIPKTFPNSSTYPQSRTVTNEPYYNYEVDDSSIEMPHDIIDHDVTSYVPSRSRRIVPFQESSSRLITYRQ